MKINLEALNNIKKQIADLKGSTIQMSINRGRKKIDNVTGTVTSVYPSVFTVFIDGAVNTTQTFSYFDVLCGDVKFIV